MEVRRYHLALVLLHWVLALLIFVQLGGGYFVIAAMPNADPAKLDALKIHMLIGTLILLLMLVRLGFRLFTAHPPASIHQQSGLGRLRTPVHLILYVATLLTAGFGWVTGFLISSVYATPGATLPADLAQYPTRVLHGWLALLLLLLIVLHVAAAIRERLSGDKAIFSRLGFGPRRG
jgi:cytochrome b561